MIDGAGSQGPGWYYAQGDPPGTQRYWDGSQWQGAPQPVGIPQETAVGGAAAGRFAAPGARFVAALIDAAISVAIVLVGFLLGFLVLAVVWEPLGVVIMILTYLGAFGFQVYNAFIMQGRTGQTFGKRHQGIKLVEEATQKPVGVGMAFVRYLLGSVIATACYLDYWWIFVDDRNQRLSDNVLKYVVVDA